jgi:hypothetical protein
MLDSRSVLMLVAVSPCRLRRHRNRGRKPAGRRGGTETRTEERTAAA